MTHVGVQVSYANSDILSSDVLWEYSRTSQVCSTSFIEVGPFSVNAEKDLKYEGLYQTIAHVSLSTTTSEVLMRQTISFVHLSPHWASGSGLGFFGTFLSDGLPSSLRDGSSTSSASMSHRFFALSLTCGVFVFRFRLFAVVLRFLETRRFHPFQCRGGPLF